MPTTAALTAARTRIVALLLAASTLLLPPLGRAFSFGSPLKGASTAVDPALLGVDHGTQRVIVQKWSSSDRAPERAVASLGGHITRDLSIINGFGATLDASAVRALAATEGIRAISLDGTVRLLGSGSTTPNSLNTQVMHADQAWAAGLSGRGVTVAVIDTGIAAVPALSGRIKPVVVDELTGATASCMNFSGEATCDDSYGHGTFVAGVIAGNGAAGGSNFKGVAPEASLVSVKLSGRDGAADVSTLLAAIQWVVSFRDRYGIKVLNLSVGSDSAQSYRLDPLNYAVEKAWDAGITVVVAASNRGPNPATITKPGDDPWVVTVGAIDDNGTIGAGDDAVPNFSARGPTLSDAYAKPDVVAPGAHVVSLRAPGSAIDANFPTYVNNHYRKGSGTSFATPAVAGTVALMLEQNPTLVPNRIKYALMSTARPTASADQFAVGAGLVDVNAAIFSAPAGIANAGLVLSTGMGSLDLSRGTLQVQTTDVVPVVIAGSQTQQLRLFDATEYAGASWHGASWHTSQWAGASWHGASWHGASWHGASWHGASWHGVNEDENAADRNYGTGWLGSALLGAWE